MRRTVSEMGVWDNYSGRMDVRGNNRRTSHLKREIDTIARHLGDNLSYTTAVIYEPEHSVNIANVGNDRYAIKQEVAVINSDNLNEKMIFALPGEEIRCGSTVCWMDQHWLVTESDANNTVYRRCKMIQCNYLLKWVSEDHEICEQWCVVEDGTKYLTGEYEDRNFVVTRGDSRIAITIARNEITARFDRRSRFLVDDPLSPHPLAYGLSKPLKFAGTYNDEGVYKFVLQEINTTDDDNMDLMIADYYKHFTGECDECGKPLLRSTEPVLPPDPPEESGKERRQWL